MKIGYVCHPGSSDLKGPYREVLNRIREIAAHCDSTGFDSIWFTEHHFDYYKRANLPNPLMMAADIAARTRRIRVGLASATIPFWHPIRLAEDLALLDQLSDGRLELGVGRGNQGVEALNLNPMADPNQPAENYAVFAETLEILKRAFSQPTFSFKGEKYCFPPPGFKWDRSHVVDDPDYIDAETGEVTKLSIMPRPVQQPHPPLWQTVDSTRSIEFAAEHGLGIIMWRPTVKKLREHFGLFQRTAEEATGRKVPFGARTAIMRDFFVAETMEGARRAAGDYVMKALNWSNWRGPNIYLDPGEALSPEMEAALKKELPYDWVHPRSLLFGSPDYIVERLEELRELGIEKVLLTSDWKDMDHGLVMQSLRLFSEKVLPRIARESAGTAMPQA